MVGTPAKRHASTSPDGEPASKRPATSSPEEGELDDVEPSPTLPALSASLPPKPVASKIKVPFPFKKKNEPVRNGTSSSSLDSKDSVIPVVYERSEEDERRFREADLKRRGGRGGPKPMPSDHWEPTYARSETVSSRHYAPRRDHRDGRDRDRGRATPSAYSPTRSRSPTSPPLSNHREKHRLPAPRTPEPHFSPPRREYGVDRIRDRERDRWDRDGDRDRRHRDDDNSRYYSRDWSRDPAAGNGDRYYRPERDPHPPNDYRRDSRDYARRDDTYDLDRRVDDRPPHDYSRDYDRTRRLDSYRPLSPGPLPPRSPPLSHPRSPAHISVPPLPRLSSPRPPSDGESRTPPPPMSSPPPPPPPDVHLFEDSALLPPERPHVTISMKRPGAPPDIHSPASMALPPALEKVVNGVEKPKERKPDVAEPPRVRPAWRRDPVRRSKKEEIQAYGRMFEGCGQQIDYEVTTKLGEGTFGEVHKAIQKATGVVVALKRILMHNEKEGMPVTALREIKILKALKHSCIVDILDMFVVRSNGKDPLSVYMVFPYMDHDLAGLLENERVKLQPSHIKLYMKQLLEGTEYMHRNHILHRDMKAANLLISNTGSLRIADFGLARAFDANVSRGVSDHRGKERKYTNCVVTRWYRPPELLLGARQYGGEVDIWGIGCVLGEMFSRRPILPGTSDLDQLEKIWQLCGTPNQHSWPNFDALPGCEGVKRFSTNYSRRVKQAYESVGPETCDLLDKLLTCNPRERLTASQALDHDYFWTDPLPADPKTLPSYEASHEFDKRGHRNQHPQQMLQADPRQLPPPGQPHHSGRPPFPPPTRDMFHTGPPPPHHGLPGGGPPHAYPPPFHPNQHHGGMPHRGRGGGGYPPHRQGPLPGGPRADRREPQRSGPAHLPPRPPMPQGRRGPREDDHGGYVRGGGRKDVNGNVGRGGGGGGGGELNYG